MTLKNPIVVASGTYGFGHEFAEFYDLSELGAICAKGLTVHKKDGNPPPRIAETPAGILNSVGLQNPGVDAFCEQEMPYLKKSGTKIIANISGNTLEEFTELAEKVSAAGVDLIEVNISCPNVKHGGLAWGTQPASAAAATEAVKKAATVPVMVKLSPNVTDITEIARAVEAAGADALSLINTLLGMRIDIETRRPILRNNMGGLSGPAVLPVAVRMIYQVANAVKLPNSRHGRCGDRGRRGGDDDGRCHGRGRSVQPALQTPMRRSRCAMACAVIWSGTIWARQVYSPRRCSPIKLLRRIPMTRIFIIRHAEAEGNLYRRLHGQYDSLLTENGLKQVAALRKRFEKEQVDACYSSDLIRTRMTAKAIYEPKHLPLQTDPRFREIRMGIWEEVPFGEVGQHEKHLLDTFNEDPAHWVIPGAERYEEYTGRFLAAMTEAAEAHDGQSIAIFSHGSVIRGVLMRLFYGADHPEQTGHCDNTGVTLLEYEAGQYHLIYKNDNSHLSEELSTLAKQSWWRQDGKTVITTCGTDPWVTRQIPICSSGRMPGAPSMET